MFFTYVLFSKKLNKRYVGFTANLDNRLKEHNSGKSKFTKSGIPWTMKRLAHRLNGLKRIKTDKDFGISYALILEHIIFY